MQDQTENDTELQPPAPNNVAEESHQSSDTPPDTQPHADPPPEDESEITKWAFSSGTICLIHMAYNPAASQQSLRQQRRAKSGN
jgi:hypothetical protein